MIALTFDRLVDIPHVITDSRTPSLWNDSVFFAMRTRRGDGHLYLKTLYDRGVRNFVVSEPGELSACADARVLITENPVDVLLKAAGARRRRLKCPVIAITGSRGKTMVKEHVNLLLSPHMRVTRSPRSWNSHIGVPMSLWRLDPDADIAIVEAGVSTMGEMASIAESINPEIGVFTSLTGEHDSGFHSLEQKCREKARLFSGCHTIIYNADTPLISDVLTEMYSDRRLVGVHGDDTEISYVVAETMLGRKLERVPLPDLSARIDITATPEGASVAYDWYATDDDGVGFALDYLRRRTADEREIVAILGAPVDPEVLDMAGVERVVTIGWGGGADSYPDVQTLIATLTSVDFRDATVYINGPDKATYSRLRDHLCSLRHITRLNVNLEALTDNFKYYRSLLPDGVGTVAMIKADAYGFGSVEVARTLQAAGVDAFAVAVVDEGITLRQAHVTRPIIVLDPWCTNPHAIVAADLEPTLISVDPAIPATLNDSVPDGKVLNVHVKLDTGMHRLGLEPDALEEFARMISRYPRLRVKSVFSHLATADCLDQDDYTLEQIKLFDAMADRLEDRLGYKPMRHLLNTAGTRRFAAASGHRYDMVRLGIGLYGVDPLEDSSFASPLQTVGALTTTIIAVTEYKAGQTVGYGRHGVLKRDSRIATLPIGYADGLNRHLGCGKVSFGVDGTECPTVGNICMDLCMIDVTECSTARVGSRVVIFDHQLPIERIARALDTIPYEVLTWISPRVKRVYHSS